MRKCLNCYFHSFIGLQNYCTHPGIVKRVKKPHSKCPDHLYYDFKGRIEDKKLSVEQMKAAIAKSKKVSYAIIGDGQAIKCHECGMISYNEGDIQQKYCGYCKEFHEYEI